MWFPPNILHMESRLQGANIIVAYGAKKLPLKGSASNGTQALGRAKVLERILGIVYEFYEFLNQTNAWLGCAGNSKVSW